MKGELADKEPVRLLVVTSTWPLSAGDQRTPFVRDLALDLAARGWDVEVLAPHAAGAPHRELDGPIIVNRFQYMIPQSQQTLAYGAGGLINFRSPVRKLQAMPFVITQILALRRAVRRFRPHLLHAHWLLPQGFSAITAAWRTGIPVVTTVHGSDVFGLRSSIFRPFKRAAINGAAAITCNSRVTRQAVLSLGSPLEKVKQIAFAPSFEGEVDPAKVAVWRQRFPANDMVALFVGRLIPEKGPADFIEAIARTHNANIRGVICGDGPMRAELEELAARRGVVHRIAFEGWLKPSDVAIRMAGADVLLFPSKTSIDGGVEGQGIVLVEAMRRGLPVLAARSGGVPDLIRDGVTGWLFAEADVDAMRKLLDLSAEGDLVEIDAVVDRARQFACNEITRDKTADAFHELFSSIVSLRTGQMSGTTS